MQDEKDDQNGGDAVDREMLIRDVAVLQVKLIVDGLRDFILVPVSLVTGFISLFRMGDPAGTEFYRLLRLGRKSERWINLFGAADHVALPDSEQGPFPDADIDELVGRLESFVVDEYREGGMSQPARNRLRRLVESLRRHGGTRDR